MSTWILRFFNCKFYSKWMISLSKHKKSMFCAKTISRISRYLSEKINCRPRQRRLWNCQLYNCNCEIKKRKVLQFYHKKNVIKNSSFLFALLLAGSDKHMLWYNFFFVFFDKKFFLNFFFVIFSDWKIPLSVIKFFICENKFFSDLVFIFTVLSSYKIKDKLFISPFIILWKNEFY